MKKPIRSIKTDQANVEDLNYGLSLSAKERLERLKMLRRINLGESASDLVSKTIVLVK